MYNENAFYDVDKFELKHVSRRNILTSVHIHYEPNSYSPIIGEILNGNNLLCYTSYYDTEDWFPIMSPDKLFRGWVHRFDVSIKEPVNSRIEFDTPIHISIDSNEIDIKKFEEAIIDIISKSIYS